MDYLLSSWLRFEQFSTICVFVPPEQKFCFKVLQFNTKGAVYFEAMGDINWQKGETRYEQNYEFENISNNLSKT